jgi:hypothetical protein
MNPPTASAAESADRAPVRPRVWPHALAAMLITLLGAGSYMLFIDNAWARETGIPSLAMMLVGLTYAIWTVAKRVDVWSVAALIVGGALTLLLAVSFYAIRLPAAGNIPAAGAAAPPFTLSDHSGKPVALADAQARGPVLLVFYRGHW